MAYEMIFIRAQTGSSNRSLPLSKSDRRLDLYAKFDQDIILQTSAVHSCSNTNLAMPLNSFSPAVCTNVCTEDITSLTHFLCSSLCPQMNMDI